MGFASEVANERVALDRIGQIHRQIGCHDLDFTARATPHRLAGFVQQTHRDLRGRAPIRHQVGALGVKSNRSGGHCVMNGAGFLQHGLPLAIFHGDGHFVRAFAQIYGPPVGQGQRARRVFGGALKTQRANPLAIDLEFHHVVGIVFDGDLNHRQSRRKVFLWVQPLGTRCGGGQPFFVIGQYFNQLQRRCCLRGYYRCAAHHGCRARRRTRRCDRRNNRSSFGRCRIDGGKSHRRAQGRFGCRGFEHQRCQALGSLAHGLHLYFQGDVCRGGLLKFKLQHVFPLARVRT